METLFFVLKIIAPFAFLLGLGIVLARWRFLDESFSSKANSVVYYIALPAMILTEFIKHPSRKAFDWKLIGVMVASTVAIAGLAWAMARLLKLPAISRGPLIQGSFRSNNVVISLPLIDRATQGLGMPLGLSLFGVILPVYNVLAVWVLQPKDGPRGLAWWKYNMVLLGRNPLIWATGLGLSLTLILKNPAPDFVLKTGDSLSALAFPLAMMAMGVESLKFRTETPWLPTLVATVLKLLVLPILAGALAWFAGYRDERLGILVLFTGAPTAVASFSMAKGMGQDSTLAASVVAATTVLSIATLAGMVGLLHLHHML